MHHSTYAAVVFSWKYNEKSIKANIEIVLRILLITEVLVSKWSQPERIVGELKIDKKQIVGVVK